MLFDDTYRTIAQPAEGVFRDKGSKFIAYAYPLGQEQDLKPLLQRLRQENPKANHFCWALRLTPSRAIYKLNDDGEPSGTAGRPILNCLLSADLTYIAVVVVRYFGGTLLGVPGLINAYKMATVDALSNAEVVERTVNDQYQVDFDYQDMNAIMRIVKDEQLTVINQVFDTACALTFEVRKSRLNQVLQKFEQVERALLKYLTTK